MVRWCVIAWIVVSLGGCSALFARGPGSRQMSCTDFPALPIFDTMLAVGSVVAIAAVARSESDCTGEHCGLGGVLAVPLIPVALVTAPSAIYGYGTVGRCRSYKREHQQEARAVEELEVEVRRLAAEGKCAELKPVWDELLAQEQALNFEHNVEYMVIAPCAAVLGATPDDVR